MTNEENINNAATNCGYAVAGGLNMEYPYELIAAYNGLADTIMKLNKKREDLLVTICGMCKCGADKCDACINLCNFTPKEE